MATAELMSGARLLNAGDVIPTLDLLKGEREREMKANQRIPRDIDEYISGFPPEVQKILERIRRTIRKAAPKAQEVISYQIPSFKLNGYLVHFAAYQSHIGLYPAPNGVKEFKDDLARYQTGKGTLRFPLDEPIPYDLITRVVKFRVKKDLEAAEAKKKR